MTNQATPALASPRAWIRLPSGGRLDLINPQPGAWKNSDLAIRLSRTYRWGGESIWSLPLSVAQHGLTVLALARKFSPVPLSPAKALRELLHDGEEGFLGFDCISPLKGVLGKPFQEVADRLMAAISTRYELPEWTADEYAVHKQADCIAAASEAVYCAGWKREEVRDVLRIRHPILDSDPLAGMANFKPWEPWPSDLAATLFLSVLEDLMEQADVVAASSI